MILKNFHWIKIIPFITLHTKAIHGIKLSRIIFDKVESDVMESDVLDYFPLMQNMKKCFIELDILIINQVMF